MAVQIWKICLTSKKYGLFDDWIKFCNGANDMQAVSKDLWEQLLDFLEETKSVADFDDSGAWPVAIDEFMEHMQESK